MRLDLWKKKTPQDRVQLMQDYERTFSTEHGQRVLRDILAASDFFLVKGDEAPALALAAHNAKRSVAVHILALTEMPDETKQRLFKEAMKG